jgi:Zn-dependent M28 family amino/carboxypeptidase
LESQARDGEDAEEFNLLGSAHYVGNLSNAQKDAIALNLNFDMVGSPNFVRFVYDGDGSDTPNAGPPGPDEIEKVFTDYFAAFNLANEPTAFDGRSDYGPFIGTTSPGHPDGIPAGGLFTGAEGIKTAAQVATPEAPQASSTTPNYHQACDTFSNNSNTAFDQMSDAAAHAVLTFSRRMSLFP